MPIVTIDLLPRSVEQKRAMAIDITEAICKHAKCPADAVRIVFRDMPPENYSVAGVLKIDEK